MSRYVYSVIRFVPDPATGEFVNIGAIAGSDESADWDMRTVSNHKRANAIDTQGVIGKIFENLAEIERAIERSDEAVEEGEEGVVLVSEEWLSRLFLDHHHLIQFSDPTPIVSGSASEALDMVFTHLVSDPAIRTLPFRTKKKAFSALLQAYSSVGLRGEKTVRRRPNVRGTDHSARFDLAVANGHAVQLAQTWSFETPNLGELSDEIKAWAWAVKDLRKAGGRLSSNKGEDVSVSKAIDIEVVYLPPVSDHGADALREAKVAFNELGVSARPEDAASEVAKTAKTLLDASTPE